jgi:protein-S-isoprenylcysteine O-methyltransferase Ste14
MGGQAVTDGLLVLAWTFVLADLLRAARLLHVSPTRRLVGIVLLAGTLATAWFLERATGGRLLWHPAAAALGLALVTAGLALHVWGRRALADRWSPQVAPSGDVRLVENGPYAIVRHPLYAAIVLLGAGTLLAHCSRSVVAATAGIVIGVAAKRRAEDRALEARLGARWTDYARRVPPLWPRFRRGTRS